MPDVPWAVGTSGTSATCSIQGFIIITCYLAFPFYYASFSIFAYVALKSNFQEEKYAWMEKWIHIGAYVFPLLLSIAAAVKDWINPALAYCSLDFRGDCQSYYDPDCNEHKLSPLYLALCILICVELAVGTITIAYLLCKFDTIQKEVDAAVGMKHLVEKARRRRLKEVAIETGLYLASFWFGYIPTVVEAIMRRSSGNLNYPLISASHCIFALQGFIIMMVYFTLQQRSRRERILPAPAGGAQNYETVSQIRANAAIPKSKRPSLRSSANVFSFRIFDGTPAEDSPWADYFDDATDSERQTLDTVLEGDDEEIDRTGGTLATSNTLSTSLLAGASSTGDNYSLTI